MTDWLSVVNEQQTANPNKLRTDKEHYYIKKVDELRDPVATGEHYFNDIHFILSHTKETSECFR
jgi:hypothetical protein